MSKKDFVHLHVHTEHSSLDGAAKIDDIFTEVERQGQSAVGISDHGHMHGVIEFYKAGKKAGIDTILGQEFYMAHEDRRERRKGNTVDDSGGYDATGKINYHLSVYAENNVGYQNLVKLSSRAFTEGYHYKPRVDWEILAEHSEGLLATTGCLGGHVLQSLLNDNYDEALAKASRLQDIFGQGNLYVELQDHGIPEQIRTNPSLVRIAREIGAPLLACNDTHYVHAEDAITHDNLLCIQTMSKRSDPNRFKFSSNEHYFKTPEQMYNLFTGYPEACTNTLEVAQRCNVDIEFGVNHLPQFPIPERFTDDADYLKTLVFNGAKKRYPHLTDTVVARLHYELDTINNMGYASYFLFVWDVVRFCRSVGIRTGVGRGSAAAACVSYCLAITQIDPILYKLPFERFLQPERASMPDIDLDIESGRREEAIDYVRSTYGADHVAQIITYTRLKSKSAMKDMVRLNGFDYQLGEALTKALPHSLMGRDISVGECLTQVEGQEYAWDNGGDIRNLYNTNPEAHTVIDEAMALEGLVRSDGIHAGAVVVAPSPLTDFLPVQQKGEGKQLVTQYSMHAVEELGLLKMDFLGLSNLDVISTAVNLIGNGFTIESVPIDDSETFDLLKSGKTYGLFQIEGSEMRELIMRLQPDTLDDIAALVALYRPGPMATNMHNDYADIKMGRKPLELFHEDAADILSETQGLMIYQEAVMQVAQRFAGYTLGEGYLLIKAIGKKKRDLMAAERGRFIPGCMSNGYEEEFATELFNTIEHFADYSFGKAHSYSYAMICYQTAYLKAHYPAHYMCSLLTHSKNLEDSARVLAESKRMGLTIGLPSVNLSESSFTVVDGQIVVGLSGLRNVGEDFAQKLVKEREEHGKYTDVYDFARRCIKHKLTRKQMESLANSGALREMGTRYGIHSVIDNILNAARLEKKKQADGQMSLLEVQYDHDIPITEYPEIDLWDFEANIIGNYVTGHPVDAVVKEWAGQPLTPLDQVEHGTHLCAVVIAEVTQKRTRKGDQMAILRVDDGTSAEVVVFPRQYERMKNELLVGTVGLLGIRRKEDQFFAEDFQTSVITKTYDQESDYVIRIPSMNAEIIKSVQKILLEHSGNAPVIIYAGHQKFTLPPEYHVEKSQSLYDEVNNLLG